MTAANPFTTRDVDAIDQALHLADHAVAALVDEAMLTPKPGLVDLRGAGAHHDLSWPLMCASACALRSAFAQMALAGSRIADDDDLLRRRIGAIGRDAEATMMAASGGINTHRGAIWALGLLVTAAAATGPDVVRIAARAGRLARIGDPGAPASTGHKGERACIEHGVGGARGQARAGFPHVVGHALPMLKLARARGDAEHHARVNALLAVMATLDDTCLLARGGKKALAAAQDGARRVLAAGGIATPNGRRAFGVLEARLKRMHVSPGGAADLLAAALLLDRIERGVAVPATTMELD
ncbi:triphosphoribosyl-dephospho-CoA synthase [Massilia pinisoli]|uniref:Probable 2-(5''-triphosphoribosyl)-3'-dephosphocoenzyme-A synthase n=1 Tax=Massilia pinisoli TaxID=1772194 RepID=A0ABT1ZJI0_9BURK|nr:triphosphoribosyl-dephospho-CoA synthase [Massilia pinisoli]MCS0580041.1 triphosphoribosyl-dephospho-CoA synthase [Massilia pinisoli]